MFFRGVAPNLAGSNRVLTWDLCYQYYDRKFLDSAISEYRRRSTQPGNRSRITSKLKSRVRYSGDSSQMLPAPSHLNPSDFSSEILIQYRDSRKNCLPYAILNVSKNVTTDVAGAFLQNHNENLSRGFKYFCFTTKIMSTNLQKIPKKDRSLAWILMQTSGCFLLEFSGHAVSIDCSRELIFDCGYDYAYRMSHESFDLLGITGVRYLARILFPKKYRHS